MGHTMVPLVQANASGLHHDCSTWDELYEDDDGELVNAWNGPTSSSAPMPSKKAKTMASSSSATVLSDVANALIPGAEVVLRMNAKAKDEAGPNHSGGLYVCRTQAAALRHRVPVRRGGLFFAPRLLLRCRCEGPFVEYPGGKIACSALTPVDVQAIPPGYLHTSPQRAAAVFSAAAGVGPSEGLRVETTALEAEVAELERRLGYR
eukprot:s572_g8.t1